MNDTSNDKSPSGEIAMALGILVPGAGQLYVRRYLAGIVTLLVVVGFFLRGILLLGTPKVPLFIALILMAMAIVIHWRSANLAYRYGSGTSGANPNVLRFGILSAIVLLLYVPFFCSKTGLLRPFKVPTNAMGPTVQGVTSEKKFGDLVFVSRFPYLVGLPKRGDLIVFETGKIPLITERVQEETVYIKRLVGLPGEEIRIKDGSVYANGRKLTLADGIPDIKYGNLSSPQLQTGTTFLVPEDGYFVLGDNSPNSWDSRGWGSVPKESVIGQAVLIYFPFGRAGRPTFDPDEVAPFREAAAKASAEEAERFRRERRRSAY